MKKGEQTRSAILDSALDIASRHGLEGLTIGAIAERLEMSKSGVFAHFGSREDLQIAVLREYAKRFVDDVFFPALKEKRGLPRLAVMFERWMDRVQRVDIPNGCVFVSGASEYDDRPGPIRDEMVAVIRSWQREMLKAANQAKSVGHLREDVDPEQLLFEIYGLLLSAHHDARLMHDPQAVTRARRGFARLLDSYRQPEHFAPAARPSTTQFTEIQPEKVGAEPAFA